MRKLHAIAIACAMLPAVAMADDLVINLNGEQTYWHGTVAQSEVDGLAGRVVLLDASRPSTSSLVEESPAMTGLWHVSVQGDGKPTEFIGHCYGNVSAAQNCGTRVVLNCVSQDARRVGR